MLKLLFYSEPALANSVPLCCSFRPQDQTYLPMVQNDLRPVTILIICQATAKWNTGQVGCVKKFSRKTVRKRLKKIWSCNTEYLGSICISWYEYSCQKIMEQQQQHNSHACKLQYPSCVEIVEDSLLTSDFQPCMVFLDQVSISCYQWPSRGLAR
jgi:hypothetical protein